MASELQLHELTDILRRRRRLILAMAAAGTMLTGAAALLIPPSYTAKGQIIFEPQYVGRPGELAPLVSPNAEDSIIATQVTSLISVSHTERVRASLRDDPDFIAAVAARPARTATMDAVWLGVADLRKWVEPLLPAWLTFSSESAPTGDEIVPAGLPVPSQEDFKRHLRAFQEAGSHVIALTYTAASPTEASAIVNRTIQLYIDGQSDQKRAATIRELAWLRERIPALKAEVDRVAAEIQGYQATHGFTEISAAASADQVADLTRQLATAEADLAARQARLVYVRSLRQGGPSLDYLGSATFAELHRLEVEQMQAEAELTVTSGAMHPKLVQVRSRLLELRRTISQEADRAVRNLENDARIAGSSIALLRQRLETLQQARTDGRLRDLKRDAAVKDQLYSTFIQRQEELSAQQSILRPDVQLLSRASPPVWPSSPHPLLFLLPGIAVFMMAGSMLAVLLDRLDRRMRTGRDVMDALGVPCLALVPLLRRIGRTRPHQSLLTKPLGAYTEAIRSVVASLRLTASSGAPKVVLISSSVPGEGKTTLAVSLATYVASLGRRVLLVDLDFRHPSVQRELGGKSLSAPVGTGVLDLLDDARPPAEVIQHLPDLQLDYLPMARRPADPFAASAGNGLRLLMDRLRSEYDCVIVDGPPLLVITEARLLASMVDKVILVAKWGSTRRDVSRSALDLLRPGNAHSTNAHSTNARSTAASPLFQPTISDGDSIDVAGVVLTQVDMKKHARGYERAVLQSFEVYRRACAAQH